MARLYTVGGETGAIAAEYPDSGGNGTPVPSLRTDFVRSGHYSLGFGSGQYYMAQFPALSADGIGVYLNLWMRIGHYPAVTTTFVQPYINNTAGTAAVRMDSQGRLLGPGGALSAAVTRHEWFNVQVRLERAAGVVTVEVRLNGVTFSTSTITAASYSRFRLGQITAGDIGLRVDDLMINDKTGAANNSWPSQTAGILFLVPKANHSAGAAWLGPTGQAITNHWDRVNNKPPKGVAQAAANTNSQQIRNIASGTTAPDAEVEFTTETPAEAGAVPGSSVNYLRPQAVIADSATGSINAGVTLTAPAAAETLAATPTGVMATYDATGNSWATGRGAAAEGSAILSLNASARLRLRKASAVATTLACCGAGVMAELDPKPESFQDVSSNVVVGT